MNAPRDALYDRPKAEPRVDQARPERAQKRSVADQVFNNSSTATTIASVPTVIAGSGSILKRGEWWLGIGGPPERRDCQFMP